MGFEDGKQANKSSDFEDALALGESRVEEASIGDRRALSSELLVLPEKEDSSITRGLKELHKIGLEIDKKLIDVLKVQGDFSEYASALVRLNNSGVNVTTDFVRSLSLQKAKDKEYVQTLIDLTKVGAKINPKFLSLEKAKNREYIQVLIDLCKAGVKVNDDFVDGFDLEKAKNIAYLKTLIVLSKFDVGVSWLSLEKAKDKKYVQVLIDLCKAGVKVDDNFVVGFDLEKARDPVYVQALINLSKAGVEVSLLSLENGKDKTYVQALIDLSKAGLKVNDDFVANLDLKKAKDPVYVQSLIDLSKAGVNVTGEFVGWGGLSEEKGKDKKYVQVLIDLCKAGVKVDPHFVANLDLEKTGDPVYVRSLIDLSKAGVNITGNFLQNLSSKKGKDLVYVQALIDLSKAGVDVTSEFIWQSLSLEKAKDKKYVQVLIDLCKAGVKVDNNFVVGFSFQQSRDPAYVWMLKLLDIAGKDKFNYSLFIEGSQELFKVIEPLKEEFKDLHLSVEELINISHGISVLGEENAKKLMKERNIYYFLRYGDDELERQMYQVDHNYKSNHISPKDLEAQAKKPVMLIVYNHSDYNGAFYKKQNKFDYLSKNFNVVLFEAENEDQFYDAVKKANSYGKITHLQIGGHGNPESIRLGSSERAEKMDVSEEQLKLDLTDSEDLEKLRPYLSGVTVVLESCSTGESTDAIGKILQKSVGAKKLYAPKTPTALRDWDVKDNQIVGVQYYDAETAIFEGDD